jgi:hypothetical protein
MWKTTRSQLTSRDRCDVPSPVVTLPEVAVIADVRLDQVAAPVVEDRPASCQIGILGGTARDLASCTSSKAGERRVDGARSGSSGSEKSAGGDDERSRNHIGVQVRDWVVRGSCRGIEVVSIG